MTRIGLAFTWFVMSAWLVQGDGEPRALAKKLAQEMGEATLRFDFAKVIDSTHDGLVKELGGREQAIKATEKVMLAMKDQGVTMASYKVEEPGEVLTEGAHSFTVVPTVLEMNIPGGKMVGKGYLLGISNDAGKSWKFVDGAGMDNVEVRNRVLPKLPAKLKLPAKTNFEVIKGK